MNHAESALLQNSFGRPAPCRRIALATHPPQIRAMSAKRTRRPWSENPLVRQCLVGVGFVLIIVSAFVGPIPGPGGIVVFAAGLGLVLKYSGWAKRLYVRLKRRHPNKGRWADWGLRRPSARRREQVRRQNEAGDAPLSD
jgi:hypothetical protein